MPNKPKDEVRTLYMQSTQAVILAMSVDILMSSTQMALLKLDILFGIILEKNYI